MDKRILAGALALALCAAAPALAQTAMSSGAMGTNPMVGGAPMYAGKTIVANAVNSKDHTTLVALVKKAGLVAVLSGPGPFTVFAPTNEAFAKVPSATLTMVGNDKALLTKVLTYHVLAGNLDSAAIGRKITAGGGKAMLKTVEGENLTATMAGERLVLIDAKGGKSTVTIADVHQSNGVIHVVNAVLMP